MACLKPSTGAARVEEWSHRLLCALCPVGSQRVATLPWVTARPHAFRCTGQGVTALVMQVKVKPNKKDEARCARWGTTKTTADEMEFKVWDMKDALEKVRAEQKRCQHEVRSAVTSAWDAAAL